MDFIPPNEQDEVSAQRLANQPWQDLNEEEKNRVIILIGKGLLGNNVYRDRQFFVGKHLVQPKA